MITEKLQEKELIELFESYNELCKQKTDIENQIKTVKEKIEKHSLYNLLNQEEKNILKD